MNMALNAHLQNLDSSQAFQFSKKRVEEMQISLICRFIFSIKNGGENRQYPVPLAQLQSSRDVFSQSILAREISLGQCFHRDMNQALERL